MQLPLREGERLNIHGTRYYRIDGKLYLSVTSVLAVVAKPAIAPWAARVALDAVAAYLSGREPITQGELAAALAYAQSEPERLRDRAAARGSARHGRIASPARDPVATAVLDTFGLEPLAHEYLILSDTDGYAGTCDLVARTPDGALAVLDWKTGGVWPEHALQLGAYARAVEEMTGETVEHGVVVQLRDDTYRAYRVDLERARYGFRAALALYRALHAEQLLQPLPCADDDPVGQVDARGRGPPVSPENQCRATRCVEWR
ncbi:CRISPR-associated protein Cas4 [Thermorudis peleae]|uniref:CRISPR-associated protein Cas4 n=1 Tax=Thermorudis peleae TaxID=1382356 RepID=UPI00069218F5|nr:PD-(D/E)XK nuclease family protein [Thermorudis peleae]